MREHMSVSWPAIAIGGLALVLYLMSHSVNGHEPARPFPTSQPVDQLQPASFKFMLRGYCYAGSPIDDKSALGGFATSDNLPRRLDPVDDRQPGKLYLLALPDISAPFAGQYRGMTLLLVNSTSKTLAFDASDSRLSIVQEARIDNGEWMPIEYLPSSWCGNSYHRVFLPAGQYWSFIAPRYTGPQPAKLRFRLDRGQDEPLISNVFDGSIHPEQFTQKQGHTATGIMDPYLE